MISRAEIEKNRELNLPPKRQMERRTGKTVEQLCAERTKRVRDAIELRVPYRVPFSVLIEPHAYSRIPNSASYYDAITLQGNRGSSPLCKNGGHVVLFSPRRYGKSSLVRVIEKGDRHGIYKS